MVNLTGSSAFGRGGRAQTLFKKGFLGQEKLSIRRGTEGWAMRRAVVVILVTIVLLLLLRGDTKEEPKRHPTYAELMNLLTKTTYAPVYPPLAEQIVKDTGVTEGVCLDLGCGPGGLSIALAKRTNLRIYGVDIDPEAIKFALENVRRVRLAHRIHILWGDATSLPFKDGFADLVVSRGMMPPMSFSLKVKVFEEAWRVLKPGGVAYIGGGFGRLLPYEVARRIMWRSFKARKLPQWCLDHKTWERALKRAGVRNFRIIYDRYGDELFGMWAIMEKPSPRVGKSRGPLPRL